MDENQTSTAKQEELILFYMDKHGCERGIVASYEHNGITKTLIFSNLYDKPDEKRDMTPQTNQLDVNYV